MAEEPGVLTLTAVEGLIKSGVREVLNEQITTLDAATEAAKAEQAAAEEAATFDQWLKDNAAAAPEGESATETATKLTAAGLVLANKHTDERFAILEKQKNKGDTEMQAASRIFLSNAPPELRGAILGKVKEIVEAESETSLSNSPEWTDTILFRAVRGAVPDPGLQQKILFGSGDASQGFPVFAPPMDYSSPQTQLTASQKDYARMMGYSDEQMQAKIDASRKKGA